MPRRVVPLKSGEYYHFDNRGHNRSDNFFDYDNYEFFPQ